MEQEFLREINNDLKNPRKQQEIAEELRLFRCLLNVLVKVLRILVPLLR